MYKRVVLIIFMLSAAVFCDIVECGDKKFKDVTVMSYDDGRVVILTSSDIDIKIQMKNVDSIDLSDFPEFNAAELYAKQKKLEQAARAYRDAYKKVPEILEQWRKKAETLRSQGEKKISKILEDSAESKWIKRLIKRRYARIKRELAKQNRDKPASRKKSPKSGDGDSGDDENESADEDAEKAFEQAGRSRILALTEEEKLNPLVTPEAMLYEFEKTLGVSQPIDPPTAMGERWNELTTLAKQQEHKRYADILEKYGEYVAIWKDKPVKWRITVKDILPASLTSSGECEVVAESSQGYKVTSLVPKAYQSHLASIVAGEEVVVSGKIKNIEFDPARFTVDAEFIEIVSQ